MLRTFPGADEFQHRLQLAELDYVTELPRRIHRTG